MAEIIGWDIGGVHLKAARLIFSGAPVRLERVDARVRYFEMWREHRNLAQALRGLRQELGGGKVLHALTMTAELADCFPGRADGVRAILGAAAEGLQGEPVRVWSIEGSFASASEANEQPLLFAASNWLATAEVAARCVKDGLLVDVGSTTSDLVPLSGGRPVPEARHDTGRLTSGELIYAGVLRTPPAALAPEVPLRGSWCRLSPEPFAFTADVYLALGRLGAEEIPGPTADGRLKTAEGAAARLARLVCADAETLGPAQVEGMARFLESAQIAGLERAARQVMSRHAAPEGGSGVSSAGRFTLVSTGVGKFLAAGLARRLGAPCRDLSDFIPLPNPQAAPATCVGLLLAEEALGARGPAVWGVRGGGSA